MKKMFFVFMVFIYIMCLAGCKEKINIDFIIDGKSHLVEIDKGTSISKDIIPLSNDEEVIELYYDENMENEYDGKAINKDLKIYVKIDIKINDNMMKKIKSKYVSEYLSKYNKNASIDEVHINNFFGVYNNAYVLIMTNDYVEYLNVLTYDNVCGYTFEYSTNNKIKVFFEDSFYTLSEAFFKKVLSTEDIKAIHEKFIK